MSQLLVKPRRRRRPRSSCDAENGGWTYVGFDLWKLKPGETATGTDRRSRGLPRLRLRQGPRRVDGKDSAFWASA